MLAWRVVFNMFALLAPAAGLDAVAYIMVCQTYCNLMLNSTVQTEMSQHRLVSL